MTEESLPQFIAHVRNDDGQFVIHELEDHLRDVAKLAGEFARDFGSADWAQVAGVWHDLGKYTKDFQQRIRLRRHFSRNPTGHPSPPRERKIGDEYACGGPSRPASVTTRHFAARHDCHK